MKQKTHSGAKKRFRLTGSRKSKKMIQTVGSKNHLRSSKNKKQLKSGRFGKVTTPGNKKVVLKMLSQ